MQIGLIRHGLTDWNALGKIQGQTDIPLNADGRKQAEAMASRLIDDAGPWDYIVSSNLSRALETARIIAERLDMPILPPDPRLIERSYGSVEGTTQEERVRRWGADWKRLDLGQETDASMQARGLDFIEDLYGRYPQSNILVVTHGSFLAQLYTALFQDRFQEHIGNLSFTILERKDAEWIPLLYNCTRHLQTIE
ncbi:histidine phosphatase family protein [Paenibacillus sp. CECT 9249]|uniref:histidine phosphatase family protein n=1 Tax=unclassified Paenibacillus TaxID=185978 RepID=UPI001C106886|nr:histidine phosphatase family protein [Paenibacillus sp. CECT 9249]MBU5443985.1 histidine phosphatase family protein [Paenibacillus sp. MSJ-34]CAH0118766.1 Phosphoserine phosphatase 1 [Paenibacillus sp. CECT 9249]